MRDRFLEILYRLDATSPVVLADFWTDCLDGGLALFVVVFRSFVRGPP